MGDNQGKLTTMGLYIAKSLDFTKRKDLEMHHERIDSCWIEIGREKQKIL